MPQGSELPGFKKFDPEKQPLTAELKAKGLTDEQSAVEAQPAERSGGRWSAIGV